MAHKDGIDLSWNINSSMLEYMKNSNYNNQWYLCNNHIEVSLSDQLLYTYKH